MIQGVPAILVLLSSPVLCRYHQFPLLSSTIQLPPLIEKEYEASRKLTEKDQPQTKIKNQWNIHHTANISVGTPPQYFQVVLDTMETLPLMIPSTNCTAPGPSCDGNPTNRYDASFSSSYKPLGDNMTQDFRSFQYRGYSSMDDVSINDITLPGFKFFEWTEQHSLRTGVFDFVYDGLIGLAPPWRKDFKIPSFLGELDRKGNLDAPMFSLELNSTQDGTGTLVIGKKDTLSDHPDTIRLPVIPDPEENLAGFWTIPIKSLSIQRNGDLPDELPFPGEHTAILDPGFYNIVLPKQYGQDLLHFLGAFRQGWINAIPCSGVSDLPDLLFTFRDDQQVRITSEEYVLKINLYEDLYLCHIAIDDAGEHPDMSDTTVILGHSFLRGFHSIWDWGSRSIALAPKPSDSKIYK